MSGTLGIGSSQGVGAYPLTPAKKKEENISSRTRSKSRGRQQPPPETPSPPGTPPPPPPPETQAQAPIPPTPRMSINKKIPTLATRLDGPTTYPAWARSIEKYLDIVEIPDSDFRVWDVVTGDYPRPRMLEERVPTAAGTQNRRTIRMWKDADAVALLTIEKNCTEDIQARIGNCETSASAYQELQKAFEGKTTTEFGALVDSFASIQFDDRKSSITEHIANYERIWNTFAGIISRVDLASDDGFGIGLKYFASSDMAKTEFLLRSFPAFYANTIENIKSKEPSYDDAVRKLREYVPARQKGGRRKETAGTLEDPLVLKTEVKDNGKRCEYCIAKGWKGLNHTEKECYTKKREKARAKKAKTEEKDDSDSEGVTIKAVRIGKTASTDHPGCYEYDTASTHHSTNEYDRLVDVQPQFEYQGHGTRWNSISMQDDGDPGISTQWKKHPA